MRGKMLDQRHKVFNPTISNLHSVDTHRAKNLQQLRHKFPTT